VDCLRERKSCDNMDDLMRAKDILGAVKRNKERIDPAEEDGGVITGYRLAHDQITEIINRCIPTVRDVKPVVHGYWWTYPDEDTDCNGNLLVWCSECDTEDHHVPGKKVPFCWHCGAEMSDEVKRLWEPPNCGAEMRKEQEHNG